MRAKEDNEPRPCHGHTGEVPELKNWRFPFNSWRNAGACVLDPKELRRQKSSKNWLPAGSGGGFGRICPLSFSRIPTLTYQGKLVYVENEVSV